MFFEESGVISDMLHHLNRDNSVKVFPFKIIDVIGNNINSIRFAECG